MKINRLKFSTAYLVGPMDHNREAGKGWRIDMSEWLLTVLGVIPFDPYNKPVHSMHKIGLEDDQSALERRRAVQTANKPLANFLYKPVVSLDLRIVDRADFLVVNFDVESKPCGTIDEMVTAANQNKPVILMCPQGLPSIFDWLWGRLKPELFFDNWDDVKSYLMHIAFDPDSTIDCLGKWKFFDLADPILRIVSQDYDLVPKAHMESQ